MTLLYKLTDINGRTRGGTQWGPGVTHSGTGEGKLCSEGWIHAYTHPLLAVLLNPIHADFVEPRLWEAEGTLAIEDHGLKVGCKTLTTVREIPVPTVTLEQRVRFGILCARDVCQEPQWRAWSDRWLSGKDRSEKSAYAAAAYAVAAYATAVAADAAARAVSLNLIALAEEACS